MTEFTPFASLLGGVLIGIAAVILMAANGRIAGISGIVSRLLPPADRGDLWSKIAFVVGLVAAPALYEEISGQFIAQTVSYNLPLMAVAGGLVGFGSVRGAGCTSGHGVCGLARLSWRSAVATVTFIGVAGITVYVMRHVIWGTI